MKNSLLNQERIESRLNEFYNALANVETMSPKEVDKLYADIQTTVDKLKVSEEKAQEWSHFLHEVTDELEAKLNDTRKSKKKFFLIPRAPANNTIDVEENLADHFARGMNLYKICIIFFMGSFAGVVIETLWCIVSNGYYESRQGLVYGPFSPLYGAGAALLTLVLYKYRNRSASYSFWGGFIAGTIVEYIASLIQETLFNSTSWDYSNIPLNINGRVCLLYSVFWGALGVFWIKSVYPRVSKVTLRIPNHIGKIMTWVVTIFLVIDMAISGLAVWRWGERVKGTATMDNALTRFLDEHYTDERLGRIFANMEFKETSDEAL